jgi:acetyl-CoA C-acetyltransferase
LLLRQPFAPDALDEVILGCVAPAAGEVNPARVAALRLGCGERVTAWTVQRNCASGLQSVDTAYRYIADSRADLILAGGTEALSHSPILFNDRMVDWLADLNMARGIPAKLQAALKFRPGFLAPVIGLLKGLTDPVVNLNMGQTAEVLADKFKIAREDMDAYSLESHRRTARAQEAGYMPEVEAIYDTRGKHYERDDGVRPDNSMEALTRLRPAFERPFGTVTPGNSSQITDGAAWLILASDDAVQRYGLTPIGRITDSAWAAIDPGQMGLGPVHASTPILRRHGFALGDIDAWEINEAFAAQVLACLAAWEDDAYCRDQLGLDRALGPIDRDKLNVDGGAIAIGHPVGSSGARIALHLLHVLKRSKGKRGIATLCIGGGQGGALLMEAA